MNRRLVAALAVALSLISVLPATALAAAPGNDNSANARVIHDLPYSTDRNNEFATTEPGETLGECNSQPEGHTMWWRYTPVWGSTVHIDLSSDFDAILTLFVNDPPGFGGCSDVGGAGTVESFGIDMDPGINFWFRVSGKGTEFGNFTLSVRTSSPVPVAHDNFADAGLISTLPFTARGNTQYATTEAGEPPICGLPAERTIWFKYESTSRRRLVATTFRSSFDTALAVFKGTSMADLTPVACNDDSGGGLHSKVTFRARPGVTYWIALGGKSGNFGAYRFRLRNP